MFFTSGDLLDAPEWDERHKAGEYEGTQHDTGRAVCNTGEQNKATGEKC